LRPDPQSIARHRRARGNARNAAKKASFVGGNRCLRLVVATAIDGAQKYLVLILVTAP
jgi:hypothetical protein